MTIFNNKNYPLIERYLKSLHQLKEVDVAVFISLLQESKTTFLAKDVLGYCEAWALPNFEREAYNIISRLQQNDLVWKTRKGLRKGVYERIGVEALRTEFEEGIEDLKEELVNIKEGAIYSSSDPRENTQPLDTERQIINAVNKSKKQGYTVKTYLRYSNSLVTSEAQKYKRFMNKLKRNNIDYDTEKEVDVILSEKKDNYRIILLSMHEGEKTKKTQFYGCQLEENGKLYKYLKK